MTHHLFQQGLASHRNGHIKEAQQAYLRVLELTPDHYEALHLLGVIAAQFKDFGRAIQLISRALEINPDNATAHANLGNACKDSGQFQKAIESYDRAIAIKPDYSNAISNRQFAVKELLRRDRLPGRDFAPKTIDRQKADSLFMQGRALSASGQYEAAIAHYNSAIALAPDFADACFNRGNAFNALQQRRAAIESYDMAISLNPEILAWQHVRFVTTMHVCDWRNEQRHKSAMIQAIERDGMKVFLFEILSITDSLNLQRKAAERWVNQKFSASPLPADFSAAPHKKIRIAYFSMDFCIHPVSTLTAELFESHDRSRFEVYAFSYGPNTSDEMRLRLEKAFDSFLDVEGMPDEEIARQSRKLGIDIAIDLAGLTGARMGVFAMRAAPVQVSYLGYPGTSGAPYIDYLIADKHLVPEKYQIGYTEKIVYLPSFQVNDSHRRVAERVFTRAELGLPESGFVYCCFNKNYKFTPDIFACWMRILTQIDGSVLLLYAESEEVVFNLRGEAAGRGVDPNRLVFGKHLPAPEYLARYRIANLFLDTFPFNAGATASDALWAGLPVLTLAGDTFASRMGASLLNAVGLEELITITLPSYEMLAVELANDPEKLETLRSRLNRNRLTAPLFNTALFTRHIENAFACIHERRLASLPAEHLHILDIDQ